MADPLPFTSTIPSLPSPLCTTTHNPKHLYVLLRFSNAPSSFLPWLKIDSARPQGYIPWCRDEGWPSRFGLPCPLVLVYRV